MSRRRRPAPRPSLAAHSPEPAPRRLPVEDTDTIVLATVDDITGGTIFLSRKFAPPHLGTTVELTQAQFDKLSVAVGNVMDHTINGNHDLVALEDVSDATILHTLRLRLEKKMIFTAIGPVLVVVNPYQPVPACSPDALKKLTADLLKTDYAGGGLEALMLEQPHCHKIVAAAYSDLKSNMRGGGAQSILVSGESGAGKTETTKICMNCLAALSQSSGGITDAALESSFLLEAIGNAKTVYNNNSSRFGKWMAVHFDKSNKILACKIRSCAAAAPRAPGLRCARPARTASSARAHAPSPLPPWSWQLPARAVAHRRPRPGRA